MVQCVHTAGNTWDEQQLHAFYLTVAKLYIDCGASTELENLRQDIKVHGNSDQVQCIMQALSQLEMAPETKSRKNSTEEGVTKLQLQSAAPDSIACDLQDAHKTDAGLLGAVGTDNNDEL